jgi:hypothetical protein
MNNEQQRLKTKNKSKMKTNQNRLSTKTTCTPGFAVLPPPLRSFGATSRRGKQILLAAALIALTGLSAVRAEEKKVTIPAGASLLVKLDTAVSSSDKPGTKFSGVIQGDLTGDGVAAVKAGTAVYGEVTEAKKAKRVRGTAEVTFALSQVRIDGQLVPIVTQPIEDIAASSTRKTAKGAAKGAAIGAIANDEAARVPRRARRSAQRPPL